MKWDGRGVEDKALLWAWWKGRASGDAGDALFWLWQLDPRGN